MLGKLKFDLAKTTASFQIFFLNVYFVHVFFSNSNSYHLFYSFFFLGKFCITNLINGSCFRVTVLLRNHHSGNIWNQLNERRFEMHSYHLRM